ncbi:MAG TPA: serine hydrolase domain-containing protein [Rudaea sp.]|nr:serine hydrolase domain-containing protein [Rudaea sp.]
MPTQAYLERLQEGVNSGLYRQLAVGWIDGTMTGPDQQQTWYLGNTRKPDADSTFEIGAASEIFTGILLAQAAIDGKVRLQTPLRDLVPKDFAFADPALGAITLRQLATRQSGLPVAPPNLFPADVGDPYAGFDQVALMTFLANDKLSADSDEPHYSILEAGLLGAALGRAYAQRFAVVLVSRVLDPLGMARTGFGDDAHLLSGYGHGEPAPHWHFGALAGAAGLRATLPDLLNFLQANLTPRRSPLRAALLLTRQPQGDAAQSVGLGWNTVDVADGDQSWPLVWRASRTAGFSVFLGFRTDKQQGLVLLGNTDADLSALGIAWLQARTPPPLPPPPPAPPAATELAAYPGLYRVDGGSVFVVRASAHGLSAQFPGRFPAQLRAVGHDVFAAAGDAFVLSFQREGGTVASVLLGHSGMNVLAQRLSDKAPALARKALAADPDTLRDYSGDYRVDSASLLRIAVRGDVLSAQPSGQAAFTLAAFAPDRFADAQGACEIRFLRNERHKVTAMKIVLAGTERDAERIEWRVPVLR